MSSNLERLLYELCDRDDVQLSSLMKQLYEKGYYKIGGNALDKLQSMMWGGYASTEETMTTIRDTFQRTGYTMDPHTAVGKWVYDEYRKETGDDTITILASTASPFKFPGDVLEALMLNPSGNKDDEVQLLSQLAGRPECLYPNLCKD